MAKLDLSPKPTLLPAEVFTCDPAPPVWDEKATDPEVAANIRQQIAAGENCRIKLHTACEIIAANDLLEGTCP